MKNMFSHFYSIRVKVLVTFFLVLLPVYILGFSLFRWGYQKLTMQIESAQLAQVRLYADSIDSEFDRIRNLQYECVHDEDLLYLVNAYPILDSFERSQYLLRVQQRLQIMKNSSTSIEAITVHLPAINKSINNSEVMVLNPNWEAIAEANSKAQDGIVFTDDNQLKMIIQYPVLPREGRVPRVVMEIELSNRKIQDILEGFSDYPDNELILTSVQGNYYLSNLNEPHILPGAEVGNPTVKESTHRAKINGLDVQQTTVRLSCADLELVSIVPNAQLFGFTRIYLFIFAAFTIVSIIVMIIFAFSIRYLVHKPVHTLVDAFSEIKGHHFNVRIKQTRNDEFDYLYASFNETMAHLQELIEKVYDQKLLTQRAELKQLQSQINPHFLYNSFYNIYRMAKIEGNENTARFSNLLSEYYQYITRNAEDEVPLEKEIHHAQIYLDIQSIRFGQRIRTDIADVPESFRHVYVPRLIIQPLLENVFEHGIQNVDNPFISLTFEEADKAYCVIVEDNGSGLSQEELKKLNQKLAMTEARIETTAIVNIHRRLILRFGCDSGLTVANSATGGLRVQLRFPREGGKICIKSW